MPHTKKSHEPSIQYESHLLRLRHTLRNGQRVCQVTLIQLPSQETRYFADLERLMAFLAEQTGQHHEEM